MTEPTPIAIEQIASLLATSSTTVVGELAALGTESGWRPAAGEWSANECVGHLLEAERRGFAGRIRQILAGGPSGGPAALQTWDPPAVAEARRYHLRSGADLAAEFATLRAESVALVLGLRPEDLDRVGIHPDVGQLRVAELLGEWVHHDRNHIRQMLEVTQSRVWPQMGNAQRFSLENL
jgi:hypothetical protein